MRVSIAWAALNERGWMDGSKAIASFPLRFSHTLLFVWVTAYRCFQPDRSIPILFSPTHAS